MSFMYCYIGDQGILRYRQTYVKQYIQTLCAAFRGYQTIDRNTIVFIIYRGNTLSSDTPRSGKNLEGFVMSVESGKNIWRFVMVFF